MSALLGLLVSEPAHTARPREGQRGAPAPGRPHPPQVTRTRSVALSPDNSDDVGAIALTRLPIWWHSPFGLVLHAVPVHTVAIRSNPWVDEAVDGRATLEDHGAAQSA